MRLALLCSLLALAACDRPPAGPPAARGASAAGPLPAVTGQPKAAEAAAETPEVTLAANGIVLVGAVAGRGTATAIEFGRARQTVLDVFDVEFPKPNLSRLAECGAGAMDFAAYGPLTLNFLGGKFVGWRAEKNAQVVTVDGIRLGNTLAEIKRERSAQRIPGTTLDGEFEYASGDGGTIGGFLDGAGNAGRVISLHAGTNCFFR